MSNEIKSTSFRLLEEDIQKFREFAEEQGLNQAEMFQSMLNSFEMAKAKGLIKDRAKEIEVFQDTINNLVNMFINSLSINQSSEERIRENLSLELNTKDKTIQDLLKYKDELQEYKDIVEEIQSKLSISNKELNEKSNIINTQQEQINTLNSIVAEYKSFKDINKELELENNELKAKITDTLQGNSNILHINSEIKSKLENSENMKEFYKNELESMKDKVVELNSDIKNINEEHKEDLKKLKEELQAKFIEEMNNKIEFEREKRNFDINNLKKREDILISSYNKLKLDYDNLNINKTNGINIDTE